MAFFEQVCRDRIGGEPMFLKANGSPWRKSHQLRPMADACRRAKIEPPINFPRAAPHVGKPRHYERRTTSYRSEEPRTLRHADGREALWPFRPFLHCRCHPRRRAALRRVDRASSRMTTRNSLGRQGRALGRVLIKRHQLNHCGVSALPPIADVSRARSKSPLSAMSGHEGDRKTTCPLGPIGRRPSKLPSDAQKPIFGTHSTERAIVSVILKIYECDKHKQEAN